MDELPVDVVWLLFEFCTCQDIYHLCLRNKSWLYIWNNQSLWYQLYRRDFWKRHGKVTTSQQPGNQQRRQTEIVPVTILGNSSPLAHGDVSLYLLPNSKASMPPKVRPKLLYSAHPLPQNWDWDGSPSDVMTFRDLYRLHSNRDPESSKVRGITNNAQLERCEFSLKQLRWFSIKLNMTGKSKAFEKRKHSGNKMWPGTCPVFGIRISGGTEVLRSINRFVSGDCSVIRQTRVTAEGRLATFVQKFLNPFWKVYVKFDHHLRRKPQMIRGSVASRQMSFIVHLFDVRYVGVQLVLEFRYSSAIAKYSTAVVSVINMQRCNLDRDGEHFLWQHAMSNNFLVYDDSMGSRQMLSRKASLVQQHSKLVVKLIPTLPQRLRTDLPGVCQLIMEQAKANT